MLPSFLSLAYKKRRIMRSSAFNVFLHELTHEAIALLDAFLDVFDAAFEGLILDLDDRITAVADVVEGGDQLCEIYAAKTQYVRRRGTPGGWFTDKSLAGGGPVLDIGVHAIDRTWYLMDRPKPLTVSAETSYRIGDFKTKGISRWTPLGGGNGVFDTEDSATVLFRFEGGKTMMAEIAWAVNGPEVNGTQLFGSKAGCTFEPLTIYTEDEAGYLADIQPKTGKNNYFVEEIRHFIDCLNSGKTPLSPIEDAITVQRMLDGIYRSAAAHREVEI